MRCYVCGKGIEYNKNLFPVEPKGTLERKWVCTDCMSIEQKERIPKDVKAIAYQICGDAKLKGE